MAKEVYTKHFDTESLRYYWYNTKINTFLWERPAGLGCWDVHPEDRVRYTREYGSEMGEIR